MTTVLKDTKLRLSPNQHQWYQILAMTKERYRNTLADALAMSMV